MLRTVRSRRRNGGAPSTASRSTGLRRDQRRRSAIFDLLHADVEWITPPSLPWTPPGSDGRYRGHQALAEYFMHCLDEVDDLHVEVTDLLSAGDRVVALGYERGHSRLTGRTFRARFAQLWTTTQDKVTRLEGFPDTGVMLAAFQPHEGHAGSGRT